MAYFGLHVHFHHRVSTKRIISLCILGGNKDDLFMEKDGFLCVVGFHRSISQKELYLGDNQAFDGKQMEVVRAVWNTLLQ
jgi:hypothetical protein